MATDRNLPSISSRAEIDAFLKQARLPAVQPAAGRLLFALDATASRGPTWAEASRIQQDMFKEAKGLAVQLAYYGGLYFQASNWVSRPEDLLSQMAAVRCQAGSTQIGAVLRHALREHHDRKVNCLVFIGDCVEEPTDPLYRLAGEMKIRNLPAFLFHEGADQAAAQAFDAIARLSGGASFRFDAGAAGQLRDLLAGAAIYATGGVKALTAYARRKGGIVLSLSRSMGGE
jgi:hypothetical protein